MQGSFMLRRDLDFILHEWLAIDGLFDRPHFADHSRETVGGLLDLSEKLAADSFLPHYKASDKEEPVLEDDAVRILPEIRDALRRYADAGLFATGFAQDQGGLQFPLVAAAASLGVFMAANIATSAYVMLTIANARLIARFGSAAQIETFALPQIEGRVLGTMCLSEPQAGSGLADIRTRAVPDGSDALGPRFRLTGAKMWISAGDHDVTEDIVHLVLAKAPGPDGRLVEGTKGISLFIVPKHVAGERNDVVVAGLNHKMGYRGTANCLLNFGEGRHRPDGRTGAVGYLIGEIGQGLPIMFQMMNEARIAVGLGAAALAWRGYRHSIRYAEERRQGRALDGAAASSNGPVPINTHPDVKRMLLAQKAYAEGALALVLFCARLSDDERTLPTAEARERAAALLGILTPVAKTWPSEWGLAANDLAIQVHGGYGYTRDFDVEQLYRDNRLNPIHEGTTGIQALDLLSRKVLRDRGRVLAALREQVEATAEKARAHPTLAAYADELQAAWAAIGETVDALLDRNGPTLDNATPFLSAFGHAAVAWLWLDQAVVCAGAARECGDAYHRGKLRACRFFFECELPRTRLWLAQVRSFTDVASGMPADEF